MMDHPVTRFIDWTAIVATATALLEIAPKLAGLAAFVWWVLRIYYTVRTRGQDK